MTRTVVWVSAGAASAIAAKLTLQACPDAVLAYCDPGGEHPDNGRFLSDLEGWFGKPVERLKSEQYTDTWDVWRKKRYLSGNKGAPCTLALKVIPRLGFQRPTDAQVFGYTADVRDATRAKRLRENYPEMKVQTPLIEAGITKAACLSLLTAAGIKIPVLYGLGFHNNNCVPCVKAVSPSYWALVRQHFPEQFNRMAALSRELNVRLCMASGKTPIFIDEVPLDTPTTDPIVPTCDFLCALAERDVISA